MKQTKETEYLFPSKLLLMQVKLGCSKLDSITTLISDLLTFVMENVANDINIYFPHEVFEMFQVLKGPQVVGNL